MKEYTINEIDVLREHLLENARELIDESGILFSAKHYARAYTLAHLSSEELSKIPVLVKVAADLILGNVIDWKKLDKDLRNHQVKLKTILTQDFMGTGTDPNKTNVKVHNDNICYITLFNTLKNVSLYSGVYQGDLYRPSQVITKEIAYQALIAAKNRFTTIEPLEHEIMGKTTELVAGDALNKYLEFMGI